MQAGAKVLVSIAAAQMALMPLSGAALAVSKDDGACLHTKHVTPWLLPPALMPICMPGCRLQGP